MVLIPRRYRGPAKASGHLHNPTQRGLSERQPTGSRFGFGILPEVRQPTAGGRIVLSPGAARPSTLRRRASTTGPRHFRLKADI